VIDAGKEEQVYRAAYELCCHNPGWVVFFREILGLEGVVRRNFPTRESLLEFERTETYHKIQHMLGKLRERVGGSPGVQEQTRVITVRLPKGLHDALKTEAHEHHTSVNKLCISKLLQFIEDELVPADS